jgi:hypothetical protein
MLYVLVQNGYVINGPRLWNRRSFESSLEEDVEISFQLPQNKTDETPIEITNGVRILPATLVYQNYNSKIEYLNGPFWNFDNDYATGSFVIVQKGLDSAKSTIKSIVADNRWRKETKGFIHNVQNTDVFVTTARVDRDIFLQKYIMMETNDVVTWKFNNVWLDLTKAELGAIVSAEAAHIQASYDWEKLKVEEIDACTTLQEIDAVDLGYEVLQNGGM